MKFQVLRFSSQVDSSNGLLFKINDDGSKKFLCYTLEDEKRNQKIRGETRIPEGEYKIELREEGGFHSRYLAKYGADFHKGMIWVKDVPNFEWILWHTGNTDENTMGCLLLGTSQESNLFKKDGFIGSSVNAYKFVYPIVRDAILAEECTVEYVDYESASFNTDSQHLEQEIKRLKEQLLKGLKAI